MSTQSRIFFNHSHHKLWVRDLATHLDVLAFHGEERLSQPFTYHVEFTSTEQDLAAEHLLGKDASFSLYAAKQPPVIKGLPTPEINPLRTLNGVITGLKRLSASVDEARYELTLQPRLALLERGRQYRIYQQQSVPEIVESILRSRHDFRGQDFLFRLVREYPRREQVMQYGESDLAFISRLLAEVGIWYRLTSDQRLHIDVVEFCDGQRGYQFDVELPNFSPAGLSSSDADGVWGLQTRHQVVEKNVNIRTYQPLDASAHLDADVDQTRGAKITYGEAYHYAEPYRVLGGAYDQHERLTTESGYFYARLRHERYLNDQTHLSGISSSATLAPGQVLTITGGGAPQAFTPRCAIVAMRTRAARDASFECRFEAMPYSETLCFRPPLQAKPQIAGTVPARVTSGEAHDKYAEIDLQGRYKVNFLFDRDPWKLGEESMWLRQARAYAGDTHGLHLPLICGTEVAIAFEQGDPDRPYIAHALHDSEHPDHVTLRNRDYTRNVLRTPANNKLRMEDLRGQEHVKLSTEYGGKSQLNLGHLVDARKEKRGEGFELRTDDWGALRAGKGLLISADEQIKASDDVLAMAPATSQIEGARQQMAQWQEIAQAHNSRPPAIDGLQQLQADAKDLSAPAILLSAPDGIGAVTPASLLLNSGDGMYLQSRDDINLAADQRLSAHAKKGISLLAQREGMRLVSGEGPLEIESHGDLMNLIAQRDITVQSVQGRLEFLSEKGITLGTGDVAIHLDPEEGLFFDSHTKVRSRGQHIWEGPGGQRFPLAVLPKSVCEECLQKARKNAIGLLMRQG
ncbi:Rhs element Vgr protein [Pseudomonas sp. GM78]|uniref:type VI secretion system Vgr family protein n=1 Tax=Pseudomonas sp. GM78 TaxID=1144337 RepID=UPI0002708278|nr:type VI secretion system Vgr family protein [Pseudomonas sp. GM78]EJN27386.1 Rhs element Vgr protein [Pseudomonas sp. GM78]